MYVPTEIKKGDIIHDANGAPHIVSFVIGNMIACADGYRVIVPLAQKGK
jgi:hypothetical protein